MAAPFLDTNVVLYLFSGDAVKAERAEALLRAGAVISVQVLNEAVSVCRRKLRLEWDEVDELVTLLKTACEVVPLTVLVHDEARAIARRLALSFYDALICAAAEQSGARTLYSEDLSHVRRMGRLRVVDPFAAG